jgi:hypothetical protein
MVESTPHIHMKLPNNLNTPEAQMMLNRLIIDQQAHLDKWTAR